MSDRQHCVVLITTAGAAEAERVAAALLAGRVAACVNVAPAVVSRYFWQGKLETEDESLLVVKTRSDKLEALAEVVRDVHSYEVPEIIALPILWGSAPYLGWLDGELDSPRETP